MRSVRTPRDLGSGTSASGRGRGNDFPAKRPRVDNSGLGGSVLSEDELWEEIDAPPPEPAHEGKYVATPSARSTKRSVSVQDLVRGGWREMMDEEVILVDAGKLKMLDFKDMRGPSPDRLVAHPVRDGTMDDFPIIDDDPVSVATTTTLPYLSCPLRHLPIVQSVPHEQYSANDSYPTRWLAVHARPDTQCSTRLSFRCGTVSHWELVL